MSVKETLDFLTQMEEINNKPQEKQDKIAEMHLQEQEEIKEIRLKWSEDEKSRTLEVIKRLSQLENQAPWYYFKDRNHPQPLEDIVNILVEWWFEVSMKEEYDLDWPQPKYVAFSRWIKHYVSDKSALYEIMDEYFSRWEIDGELLINKFPDYYWNHRSGKWHPDEYVPEIKSFFRGNMPKRIEEWIWDKTIGELATEFVESQSWDSRSFIKAIISYRLGGIEVKTKFINKLAKMNELEEEHKNKHFTTELLGLFTENDNQRTHFHNPLAIDIGTPFLNLSQAKDDKARKQKIRNAKVTSVGTYSLLNGDMNFGGSGNFKTIRTQLAKADILIGYNLWDFDLEVLKANGLDIRKEFPDLVIYDIMRAIYGKHSSVRVKLSELLLENGLPEKNTSSNRTAAAGQDAWAALGCFFLLTTPSMGLSWKDSKLRTDIFEGVSQLREISEIIAERDSYEVKIEAWILEYLK